MKTVKTLKKGQKLVYFLSRLSREERKRFRKYLLSPYFGKSPRYLRVLEILEKKVLAKGLDYVPLKLFQDELSPEKPFGPEKMEYIRLRLVQFQERLLEFLALQRYRSSPRLQQRYLLEEAISRKWEKVIPEFHQKGLRGIETVESGTRFLAKFELERLYNGYLSLHAVRGKDLNLNPVLQDLDHFYLLQKLKLACAVINLRLIWGEEREVAMLEAVLQEVEKDPGAQPAVIQAFFHTYKMLWCLGEGTLQGQFHFEELLQLMENPRDYLVEDANALFLYGQNYCTLRFNLGDRQIFTQLKGLYDRVLESGTILEGGLMSPRFYKNTVNLMCRAGELDPTAIEWVESFIEEFKDKISGDGEGLAYIYNLAVLRFYQNSFQETVRLLFPQITRFEMVLYAIGARTYLCRALWSQREWEWLLSTLHAFRQFVHRKRELSSGERANTLKFINYFEQITKAMTLPSTQIKARLEQIQEKLHAGTDHLLLVWVAKALREKIENF